MLYAAAACSLVCVFCTVDLCQAMIVTSRIDTREDTSYSASHRLLGCCVASNSPSLRLSARGCLLDPVIRLSSVCQNALSSLAASPVQADTQLTHADIRLIQLI